MTSVQIRPVSTGKVASSNGDVGNSNEKRAANSRDLIFTGSFVANLENPDVERNTPTLLAQPAEAYADL